MQNKRTQILVGSFIVLLILFLDQYLKIWVKTNMAHREQIQMAGDWFYLHFIENPGMAYGWKFWGDKGKILLTCFRMVAAVGISIYILRLIKKGIPYLSLVFFSLILAGALGNIIDSVFYGQWFTQSTMAEVAVWASGDGYAPYLMGSVVDMFYFPLIDTYWPDWVPFFGGSRFEFFKPVFNIADAAITSGVIGILLFQRSIFAKEPETEEAEEKEVAAEMNEQENINPESNPIPEV